MRRIPEADHIQLAGRKLLIVKVLTKMPSPIFKRYRIVEVTPTVDGPRWRFTNYMFGTFREAQAQVKSIRLDMEDMQSWQNP